MKTSTLGIGSPDELQRLYSLAKGRPLNFGRDDLIVCATLITAAVAAAWCAVSVISGTYSLLSLYSSDYLDLANETIYTTCGLVAVTWFGALSLLVFAGRNPALRVLSWLRSVQYRLDINNPDHISTIVNYLDSEAKRRYENCMEPINAGLTRIDKHLHALNMSMKALNSAGALTNAGTSSIITPCDSGRS